VKLRRLNSGSACCPSVQNLFVSSLLSENINIKICSTIILPVVLYGCETGSPTFRDERSMSVFGNTFRVRKKSFVPHRDDVTGEWERLHNEELHDLYSSPDVVRVIKARRIGWTGNVARMAESRCGHRVIVGKAEGRRSLERP